MHSYLKPETKHQSHSFSTYRKLKRTQSTRSSEFCLRSRTRHSRMVFQPPKMSHELPFAKYIHSRLLQRVARPERNCSQRGDVREGYARPPSKGHPGSARKLTPSNLQIMSRSSCEIRTGRLSMRQLELVRRCFPTASRTSSTFEVPARLWIRGAAPVWWPYTIAVKTSGPDEPAWLSPRELA
jgi:hypothetical protein